jgi:hypothetical protein
LTITDSTVSNNTSGLALFTAGGQLTITDSTVSNNTADVIFIVEGDLTMIRTTIADNEALVLIVQDGTTLIQESTVSGNGAGITGNVTVINSTIVGSNAVGNVGDESPAIRGTLISGDCSGDIVSDGYNIESPGNTCGFDQDTDLFDVTEGQLNLGPLADNGGPTETHALLPGSFAIDWIPQAACVDADGEPLTEDQRGEPRPAGPDPKRCDVGAFEVQP